MSTMASSVVGTALDKSSLGQAMKNEAKKSAATLSVKSMLPMLKSVREKFTKVVTNPNFQHVPQDVRQELRRELALFFKLTDHMRGGTKRRKHTLKKKRTRTHRKKGHTRRKRSRKVMKGGERDWRHDCYKNCYSAHFGDLEDGPHNEVNDCDTNCKYPRRFDDDNSQSDADVDSD